MTFNKLVSTLFSLFMFAMIAWLLFFGDLPHREDNSYHQPVGCSSAQNDPWCVWDRDNWTFKHQTDW